MKRSDTQSVLAAILAAVGVSAVGLALGLKRLVWGLWIAVSVIWAIFVMSFAPSSGNERHPLYLVIAFGPPVVVFLVLRLLTRIVSAVVAPLAGGPQTDASLHGPRERVGDVSAEPAEPPWHEVLHVSPSASYEEIRNAYKTQMSQYHPDKVASLGDELRSVAERKSKQITTAYRQAMQLRGVEA